MTDDSLVFCCRNWNPIFLLDVYWHKLSWPQLSSHQVLCNESQCFEIMEIQSWWNNYGGCQGWINNSHPSMLQWKVAATLHSSSTLFNVYGSAVLTTSQSHSREMVPLPGSAPPFFLWWWSWWCVLCSQVKEIKARFHIMRCISETVSSFRQTLIYEVLL